MICDTILVTTKSGILRGRIDKLSENLGGKKYFSFEGIPYAQPPIGELRFKAPVALKPWKGVRDALTGGPCSLQQNMGNEDCLYLNIYIPEIVNLEPFQLLPVILWIHGGKFYRGHSQMYGPEFFMKKGNVILVTINYRLGALGFMSLGTDKIPGNAGLKDQMFAIKWIKNNISRFRGDCENITLIGDSSGGLCVLLLMLNPQSKDLFHRVIIQSSSIFCLWSFINPKIAQQRAIKLANNLGCKCNDLNEIANMLCQVPATKIVSESKYILDGPKRLVDICFSPTIEPTCNDAFITEDPRKVLLSGNFVKIPIIFGCMSQEGLQANYYFNKDETLLERSSKDISVVFTRELMHLLNEKPEKKMLITKKINRFYFQNKTITLNEYPKIIEFLSDLQIIVGMAKLAKTIVKIDSKNSIYFYMFDYDGGLGYHKNKFLLGKFPVIHGICHGDSLGYIFKMEDTEPKSLSTDYYIMEKMIDVFTNFAIDGNPSTNMEINWEPFNIKGEFLRIDTKCSLERNFIDKKLTFWQDIFNELDYF